MTRLTVPFDWDHAAGKSRQSVVLDAPATLAMHSERAAALALPWVRKARMAISVAMTYLQWRARPVWTLIFSTGPDHREVPPGSWIEVSHPRLPYSGRYVVTDLDPGIDTEIVKVTAQAAAGLAPAVRLVQSSGVF